MALAVGWAFALAAPAPARAQTPAPAVAAPTPAPTIPPDEDPNAPGLARAERIRRQEAYIQKMLKQDEDKRRQETLKQIENRLKEAAKNKEDTRGKLREKGVVLPTPGGPQAFVSPTPAPGALPMDVKRNDKSALTNWAAKLKNRVADDMGFRLVTIYLDPANVVARPGEVFNTRLKLLSQDKTAVDRLDIYVYYPPSILRLVSTHQDKLAPLIEGEAVFETNPELGWLHYAAKLARPINSFDADLLTLRWVGLQRAGAVEISLDGPRGETAGYFGRQRVTENEFGAKGGLVNSTVRIDPGGSGSVRDPIEQGRDTVNNYVDALGGLREWIDRDPPSFRLVHNACDVYRPGDWVVMDVLVENPDKAAADEVRLTMEYDPDVVEVADADRNNLVREGANSLDGPFRRTWGWNDMIRNQVDQAAGRIEYWVRRREPEMLPSGPLTRIFLRVLRETTDPLVAFVPGPSADPERPGTGFYLMGENLDQRRAQAVAEGRAPGDSLAGPAPEKADPALYRERPARTSPQKPRAPKAPARGAVELRGGP